MPIEEEHIEVMLRAIRSVPYEDAREHLRTFAADCRFQGMIDLMNTIEARNPMPKSMAEYRAQLAEKVDGSSVEKDLKGD